MTARNRVRELRTVRAGDLIPDERNWRRHPPGQRRAVAAMLERIGYADAVIARETDAGLVLIDGHLRAELDPDQPVPVLVVDLDEDEAGEVLATLDPLAAMARQDDDALRRLIGGLDADLPDDLVTAIPPVPDLDDIGEVPTLQAQDPPTTTCPRCGHAF